MAQEQKTGTKKYIPKVSGAAWEDVAANCRYKVVETADGREEVIQRVVADRLIFNPEGVVRIGEKKEAEPEVYKVLLEDLQRMTTEELQQTCPPRLSQRRIEKEALREAAAELASNADELLLDHPKITDDNALRAARRARTKVYDYVRAEYDFMYFVTLTLSGADFARDDVKTATRKLQDWLRNKVQRDGLKYILVPEYHKDGKSLHWHGFINAALPVVESGTYIPPGGGKPIKAGTVKKRKLRLEDCKTVYNIPGWTYGFTTAIEIYGSRAAAAAYVAKYITKAYQETDGNKNKIGGRYYLHSSNIRKPRCFYALADYEAADGWETQNPGAKLKIKTDFTEFCNTEEEKRETWCGATKEEWADLYESASTE